MAEDSLVERFMAEMAPLIIASSDTAMLSDNFAKVACETFDLDRARIIDAGPGSQDENALHGYVMNTRKAYVDNQLSEYSSFSELISMRGQGFCSCAVIPIIVGGRVTHLLEMLSKGENTFTENLMADASKASSFMGFVIMYNQEHDRSVRIANYFNGAFYSAVPQLLVSDAGTIIRANSTAQAALSIPSNKMLDIKAVLGMDYAGLSALAGGKQATLTSHTGALFRIGVVRVSDKLLHVSATNVTDLERFRAVLDAMRKGAGAGVLYVNRNMVVTESTPSMEGISGYSASALTGKPLSELLPKSDFSSLEKGLSSMQDGKPVSGTANLVSAATTPTLVKYVASKTQDGFMLLLTNAEPERYVERLRSSLVDFISNSSDVVLTSDAMGYITDANMPVELVLGYPKSDLTGKELRLLYADPSILDRDMTYVRDGGKVDNSYIDMKAKDGSLIPATHSMRAFKDIDNALSYMIVIKELRTKRTLRDQESSIKELEGQKKRLMATSDLKSMFIYNISHELKTPLTNIKGYASFLKSGEFGPLNEDQKSAAATVIEETDRLVLIIQQVLDAAKLDSNKVKLELKDVSMQELQDNPSIVALKEMAQNKGLSFKWNVEYDLPSIVADPNRLIQIFVNLIGNSLKFTEKGGISVKISRKSKKFIMCEVSDTGIGISDEDKHKLFRNFYEAHKKGLTKQQNVGTGLGLSITKSLVKLHGGRIGVDSEQGKGSKFWFTLRTTPKPKKKE